MGCNIELVNTKHLAYLSDNTKRTSMTSSLVNLAAQLIKAIMPIIIVSGIIGNSLNVAILTRPNLYKHACSHYFLAVSVNNIFFSSVLMTYEFLAQAYNIDAAQISITWCKLINFTNQLSALITPYFIVLASFDRYCASSTNVWKRRFSSVKMARWMILLITAILALFYVNVLIFSELRQDDGFGCRIRTDSIYKLGFVITQVVLFVIVAPFLMALFGILTIWNVNRTRLPAVGASRYRRTESQLVRMLLLQITIQIILNLPLSIIYIISFLPLPLLATPEYYLTYIVCELVLFSSFVTPFFLYVLSAQAYKKELIHLVSRVLRFRNDIQVNPITNQGNVAVLDTRL